MVPSAEGFRPSVDTLGPRDEGLQSILTRDPNRGLWLGSGCGFALGRPAFVAVSFYPIVASRQAPVLGVMIGGGSFLPYRWFAIGAGFGRTPLETCQPERDQLSDIWLFRLPCRAFRPPLPTRLDSPIDVRNARAPRYSPQPPTRLPVIVRLIRWAPGSRRRFLNHEFRRRRIETRRPTGRFMYRPPAEISTEGRYTPLPDPCPFRYS